MGERSYWVYLMASRKGGALYVGVTSDLARRAYEHRQGVGSQHTNRYRIKRLVYAEPYPTALEAIEQEKRIKKWKCRWKVALIEKRQSGLERSDGTDVALIGTASFRPKPTGPTFGQPEDRLRGELEPQRQSLRFRVSGDAVARNDGSETSFLLATSFRPEPRT